VAFGIAGLARIAGGFTIAAFTLSCAVTSGVVLATDRISFSSFRPSGWNIYLLESGRAPRQLTDGPALNYDAVFSPDGRFVVFTSERSGIPQLFVMNVERSKTPRLLVRSDGFEDQATFSPDGRTLAFVADREGNADLYSVPFDPGHITDIRRARRLTDHPAADLRPSYSPDGKTIVFTSTRDSVDRGHPLFPFAIQSIGNLYTLDLASGKITRLTKSEEWDGSAVYSRDGKEIYFYSERLEPHYPRLFVMNADGSGQRATGADHRAIKPAPLADGRIAYETWHESGNRASGWELRIFDPRDGSDSGIDAGTITCHNPSASPSGTALLCHGVPRDAFGDAAADAAFPGPLLAAAFPTTRRLADRAVALYAFRNAFSAPLNPVADEVMFRPNPASVDVLSLATGQTRPLVRFDASQLTPAHRAIMGLTWSPDGKFAAFSVKRFRNSSGVGEIWTVNADGSALRKLTGDGIEAAGMPSWSENDAKIAFTARVGSKTQLMRMNADGSGVQQLSHSEDRENFAALSPDGRWLVYASDHDGIADPPTGEKRMSLYLAKISPQGDLIEPRRLTQTSAQVGHPRFSPDGRWIIYASGEGGLNDESPFNTSLMFSPQPYGEIWAQRLADGLRVRLTHDKWEDGAPFWAPPVSASRRKK
jgi:Tol biopolymer transport system component